MASTRAESKMTHSPDCHFCPICNNRYSIDPPAWNSLKNKQTNKKPRQNTSQDFGYQATKNSNPWSTDKWVNPIISPGYCLGKNFRLWIREGEPGNWQSWVKEIELKSREAKMARLFGTVTRRQLHTVPEICRGSPSNMLLSIDQCMHVRKLPAAWERTTWRFRASDSHQTSHVVEHSS